MSRSPEDLSGGAVLVLAAKDSMRGTISPDTLAVLVESKGGGFWVVQGEVYWGVVSI